MPVLFDEYRPFDNAPTYADGWRKMMRHVHPDGPLITGISDPSDWDDVLRVYADESGHHVKVKPGEVWIQGHHAVLSSEAVVEVPSPDTQTRFDLIVARLDADEGEIVLDVVTGDPAPSGQWVIPSPTRSGSVWEVPLAHVMVIPSMSELLPGVVADRRRLVGFAEGEIDVSINSTPIQGNYTDTETFHFRRAHGRMRIEGTVTPSYALTFASPMPYPPVQTKHPISTDSYVVGTWASVNENNVQASGVLMTVNGGDDYMLFADGNTLSNGLMLPDPPGPIAMQFDYLVAP